MEHPLFVLARWRSVQYEMPLNWSQMASHTPPNHSYIESTTNRTKEMNENLSYSRDLLIIQLIIHLLALFEYFM